mmetsp:Transcript_6024/g.19670  ORF Transcript_6024/g.19670 Transcript_6024/m.19670 type:complete len:227 (+) Transcript_6024:378-1058(+)
MRMRMRRRERTETRMVVLARRMASVASQVVHRLPTQLLLRWLTLRQFATVLLPRTRRHSRLPSLTLASAALPNHSHTSGRLLTNGWPTIKNCPQPTPALPAPCQRLRRRRTTTLTTTRTGPVHPSHPTTQWCSRCASRCTQRQRRPPPTSPPTCHLRSSNTAHPSTAILPSSSLRPTVRFPGRRTTCRPSYRPRGQTRLIPLDDPLRSGNVAGPSSWQQQVSATAA